jgi:glycosyltransferase involved in cell wall biosynthesis
MRIGMMADLYKPYISGVTTYIVSYKRYFESQGHTVFVFTFGDENYQDDEPHVVRSPSLPLALRYGDKDITIGVRYSKEARRFLESMQVVHVQHPFLSGQLALRYCRPHHIPVVFTNHTRYDLYAQAMVPQLPDGIGRAFLEAYIPPFCRACNLVIAPAAGVRGVLQGFGVNTPIEVIPNGVDLTPYNGVRRGFPRETLGFSGEDIILIYVGRLGPEKNLSFLLRAFAGAAKAYDNIRLLLVGDGPERENLEDRVRYMGIANLVRFTGLVPHAQIPEYFGMADIFVTSSVSEVHPLSVIEAMAAGLPVLGIDSPGVSDIVEDGITGFLSSNDLASYTAKMVRMVVDNGLREKMIDEGKKVVGYYTIERTGDIVLEHYQRLIDEAARQKRGLRSWVGRLFSGVGK